MDQKQLEAAVDEFAASLWKRHRETPHAAHGEAPKEGAGAATEQAPNVWPVVRALIHRAVHLAASQGGVEYCTLATYLGEMLTHGHALIHGNDPRLPTHADSLH